MTPEPSLPGTSRDNPGLPGTLLFENEQLRIWELVMQPGEYCQWHAHPCDHLLVVIDGAVVEGIHFDGRRVEVDLKERAVYYVPATERPEAARNICDRPLRELIIDLKTTPLSPNSSSVIEAFRPGALTTATRLPTY